MAAGYPERQIDLFHDDADIAICRPQRQRMKGELWKWPKDPLKIIVILSISKKDELIGPG